MLAALTPLGRVADEPAHALRAASLLHGQWIGRRAPVIMPGGAERVMAGLDADGALLGVQGGSDRPKLLQDHADWSRAQVWAGTRRFHEAANVAVYMPVFYAPAAVGMGVARAAGAGPFGATYAARMVNVACFAALGLAALLLARRGHALLFCTLTLPMTLSLAGSVNQDGLIIGSSALAAALLSRGAASAPPGWAYWAAAVLLACIVAVKPPYAPLLAGLLLPLPPVRAWPRLRGPLLSQAPSGLAWGSALCFSVVLWAASWAVFARVRSRLAFWV